MDDSQLIHMFPKGEISPPPSKSFGHRALICASLAAIGKNKGESVILNSGDSEDISATRRALELFGVEAERQNDQTIVRPSNKPPQTGGEIDCGESGSTLRFLIPLAATAASGRVTLTGSQRLLERPLAAYANILAAANVSFTQNASGVTVEGTLGGGHFELPGNVSSQFVSGLLMALPLAKGDSLISLTGELESAPYVDMTLETLAAFGIKVTRPTPTSFAVIGGQSYQSAVYKLESDYSQAAFFLAAAALGRPVSCLGLNPKSVQGDRAVVDILNEMGAKVVWSGDAVTVKPQGRLKAATIDLREIPDLGPILTVLAALADGTSHIINAGRLRIKESDRLSSMTQELRKMGAEIIEKPDSLTITGRPVLNGDLEVDSHNDHRVAMSLAVASIACQGLVKINGASCVNKSYPCFWHDFGKERISK